MDISAGRRRCRVGLKIDLVRWRMVNVRRRLCIVSTPLVRRLRLPAAGTSPAAARGAVSALLGAVGLGELRDEALLLTSELVTNGVVHAGTDLELEISADPDGVQITVTDFASPNPALVATEVRVGKATGASAEPAEGGRGLLLVSKFATRWGTSHESGGRTIWFRIDRRRSPPLPRRRR
jgi:phosphoserine phosphatase RsbU/P